MDRGVWLQGKETPGVHGRVKCVSGNKDLEDQLCMGFARGNLDADPDPSQGL